MAPEAGSAVIRLEKAVVRKVVRRNRSLNGNTRWSVVLEHEAIPNEFVVRTRTDSSWGHEVEMLHVGDTVDVAIAPGNWVDGIWKVNE